MFDEQTEQRMFEPHLCDDNIVVVRRKQSFVANKIVLTAFSWFSLLLFTQTKWLQQFELITEVLTSQSFNQILCFIYTSSLNVIACDVWEVVNIVRVLQTSHIANSCKNLIDSCASYVAGMAQEGKQCSQISPPFYCNADKELDLSTKIYPREGNKPYLVKVEDTMAKRHLKARDQTYYEESKQVEDVHGMEGDAEDSDDSDDQRSYNREQIIVEVNLNNQTLHVSKGAEGVSSRSEKNAMVDSSDGENEDGDDEEDEDADEEEEEEDDIDSEDDGQDDEEIEEDNIKHRKPKETTRMGTAEATPSRESTKIVMPEQRKRKSKDSKAPTQKGKQIEEKQNLTCEKCPRVFNNRWYLEKHMNVTHSRMQICDKCGKKFVLESELVLHQQTECEKNIQVG